MVCIRKLMQIFVTMETYFRIIIIDLAELHKNLLNRSRKTLQALDSRTKVMKPNYSQI